MKTVEEFKAYVKESVKRLVQSGDEYNMVIWDLTNGDQIYFKSGFRKPHAVSPDPFKGAKYGDFGYDGCISWEVAFRTLKDDEAFEEV